MSNIAIELLKMYSIPFSTLLAMAQKRKFSKVYLPGEHVLIEYYDSIGHTFKVSRNVWFNTSYPNGAETQQITVMTPYGHAVGPKFENSYKVDWFVLHKDLYDQLFG